MIQLIIYQFVFIILYYFLYLNILLMFCDFLSNLFNLDSLYNYKSVRYSNEVYLKWEIFILKSLIINSQKKRKEKLKLISNNLIKKRNKIIMKKIARKKFMEKLKKVYENKYNKFILNTYKANVNNEIYKIKHKKSLNSVLKSITDHDHEHLWKFTYFSKGLEGIENIIIDWEILCKKEKANKIIWWDINFLLSLFKYCKEENIKIFIISELKPLLVMNIINEILPNYLTLSDISSPYNYHKSILSQPRRLPTNRIAKKPCKVDIDQILDDLVEINNMKKQKTIFFGDQNQILRNTFNIPALYFELWQGIYLSIYKIINE